MIGRGSELRIGTLRTRGEAMDRPARRLAVEQAFRHAELVPSGLPPDAVLVVRRIEQRIAVAPRRTRDGGEGAWADAVRTRLDALYRSAARPERGRVASDSEAVLFLDRAELLACLARDLAEGLAWRHWWWAALLAQWRGDAGPSEAITTMLLAEPETLPATLAALHGWGQSERVLHALSAGDVHRLLVAVARSHGLQLVARVLERPERGASSGPGPTESAVSHRASLDRDGGHPTGGDDDGRGIDTSDADSAARGSGSVPRREDAAGVQQDREVARLATGIPATLGYPAALLLGLSLASSREAWRARTEAFQAAALRRWWPSRLPMPATVGESTEHRPASVRRHEVESGARARDTAGGSPASAGSGSDGSGTPPPAGPRTASRRLHGPQTDPGRALAVPGPATSRDAQPQVDALEAADGDERPGANEATSLDGDADGLTTELGGVLYLVNLMSALELPECFEEDWRLASRLGPWALLELLARALIGSAAPDLDDDPLWSALARLDGRGPAEAPGAGFVAGAAYRLPRRWRDETGEDEAGCRWASATGWLRIWSEAGWVLAEVPRDGATPSAQARREMLRAGLPAATPLHRAAFAAAPVTPGRWSGSRALDRLLGLMLPFVRRRLALALGAAADDHAALLGLLRLRARLHLTSSHVDLVARIDDVSLPARRAGLDRDPGWLPAFGRVLLFHFE